MDFNQEDDANLERTYLVFDGKCMFCIGLALRVRNLSKCKLTIVPLQASKASELIDLTPNLAKKNFYIVMNSHAYKGTKAIQYIMRFVGLANLIDLGASYIAIRYRPRLRPSRLLDVLQRVSFLGVSGLLAEPRRVNASQLEEALHDSFVNQLVGSLSSEGFLLDPQKAWSYRMFTRRGLGRVVNLQLSGNEASADVVYARKPDGSVTRVAFVSKMETHAKVRMRYLNKGHLVDVPYIG